MNRTSPLLLVAGQRASGGTDVRDAGQEALVGLSHAGIKECVLLQLCQKSPGSTACMAAVGHH